MKIKAFLIIAVLYAVAAFGTVERSIIPAMSPESFKNLGKKVAPTQMQEIEEGLSLYGDHLRVMSFNMLLNYSEAHLEPVDRWDQRKSRVTEYIKWASPDIIGSQELQPDQLDFVMNTLGDEYDYYGLPIEGNSRSGDIPAIFYRKARVELVSGATFYFSPTPEHESASPFGNKNTFTYCQFRDRKTGNDFVVLNTHLAFGNVERRYYEACILRDFLINRAFSFPTLVTGDFNTFPFRQELATPFYDGPKVIKTIEDGLVKDSMNEALFGHFGPISSTNFCEQRMKPFCSEGTPGVILDHVFVNYGIKVLNHGIDPAIVDGHFPSDHFPVIVDFVINPPNPVTPCEDPLSDRSDESPSSSDLPSDTPSHQDDTPDAPSNLLKEKR